MAAELSWPLNQLITQWHCGEPVGGMLVMRPLQDDLSDLGDVVKARGSKFAADEFKKSLTMSMRKGSKAARSSSTPHLP